MELDDNSDRLSSEKNKYRQTILDNLLELYFLKHDGLMCDYHTWGARERFSGIISQIRDDDLISEQKFSQLLNLGFDDKLPKTTSTLFDTATTTTNTAAAVAAATHHHTSTSAATTASHNQQQITSSLSSSTLVPTTTSLATLGSSLSSTTTNAPPSSTTTTSSSTSSSATPTSFLLASGQSSASSSNSQQQDHQNKRKRSLSPEADLSLTTTKKKRTPTQLDDSISSPQKEDSQDNKITQHDHSTTRPSLDTTASSDSTNGVQPMQVDSISQDKIADHKPSSSQAVSSVTTRSTTDPTDLLKSEDQSLVRASEFLSRQSLDQDNHHTSKSTALTQNAAESRDRKHSLTTDENTRVGQAGSKSKNGVRVIEVDVSERSSDHQLTPTAITSTIASINSTRSKGESPTRISKVFDPLVTPASVESHQKQIFERAKHEATVTARIAELRKLGLWSAKRLPKLQDPARPKTQWDYLLEEMRWLSADFDAERKWKRRAAKKCAQMVYKYHQDKHSKIERAEREHTTHIKKLAASQAKEIRSFWSSIEKIVDFRQQTKLEETRKKAWGLHLNYILDQTSKFSNTCMEDTTNTSAKEQDMEIDYLMSQDGDKDVKEPVINDEEQTKPKHEVDDIAAGAESIQPKGNTFETTTVSTKVPFLLKHNLREYQHIGLDWLVNMYHKKLNGILADEMGLGKTIQTIALLAHLACEKGEWGPHLIVVPTSVMLNWEMEIKKWCPAFKILTYFGNPKERKMKRVGWSRPNSFHICITSYRIVIQDHAAFRRKKWCYFILDEAHYIKNFKSQRWQMLLNFNSQRRLLLTGTPLQNDLMELWSLMHFLMPNLFDSYREFKDWFVNPLTGMIEGSHEHNQDLVQRLHKILRPFLLRRLKADVEKQLPRKREFIKTCRLSKRQRFLYEEFMSLSKTKETLASGNFLSVINVLMQLRKVCNHPNLFEPRPTVSPFMMEGISYKIPGIVTTPVDYDVYSNIDLCGLQLIQSNIGANLTSLASQYVKSKMIPSSKFLDIIDSDFSSDSSSTIRDDASSVLGESVDKSAEVINCTKITDAFSQVKELQKADKNSRLMFIADLNDARCKKADSLYFSDLQERLKLDNLEHLVKDSQISNNFSNGNGRTICHNVPLIKKDSRKRHELLTKLIEEAVKTPEQVCHEMSPIIDRFVFCITGATAPRVSLHASHLQPFKKAHDQYLRKALYEDLSPRTGFLSRIMVNMRTTFPELRLIEYDCGKLQTLGRLLNELKPQDHRVLIFTQMSRMLDILEQFLNYHGHTYLRLDGATKIDQRQILMERFNNDRRIFCFILSTRSGGIGVNLTGADTVIFYDSDWNPTMDAQAQDRCHRIGQTRDVHIYRLISEDTIEKNIFMKAQQKRMLGDLAIEDGNFNTTGPKRHAIHELFNVEPSKGPVEVDKVTEVQRPGQEMTKAELNKLEQVLSKGEADAGEDVDVDAIKVARADVDTDLREFDESIPITEANSPVEKSDKEQQIDTIVSQMTPVEQYAVKFLESLQKPKNKEELEQAEMEYRIELENKKSQWEQSRVEMLKEQASQEDTNETLLTYARDAKCDHVHYLLDGDRKVEEMPLWAPPTPPTSPPSPVEESSQHHYHQPAMTPAMAARINAMGGLGNIFGFDSYPNKKDVKSFINEKDLYVDFTTHFLYEPNVMLESQLPQVDQQYTESEVTSYTVGSKKIRLTGTAVVPGGFFQNPAQLPHLQHHLQNLTNQPTTPDGSSMSASSQQAARRPKVRRDEVICLPKSIFDRQTPNFAKIRRELKLQKLRCVTKGNDSDPFAMQKFFHSFSLNPLGQSLQQENIVNQVSRQIQQYQNANILLSYCQDQLPPWTIQEEWALLMVIQHLQDLPVNLCILTPAHTPNWELVSEVISDIGFAHRSYKMCEYHFASTIQKREMTRDSSWDERSIQSSSSQEAAAAAAAAASGLPPAKKSKKSKQAASSQADSGGGGSQTPSLNGQQQQLAAAAAGSGAAAGGSATPTLTGSKGSNLAPAIPFKPSKTGSMLTVDRSLQLSFNERFEIIRRIRQTRPKPPKTRYSSRERPMNSTAATAAVLVRDDKHPIDQDLKPEIVISELNEERRRRRAANLAAAAAVAAAAASTSNSVQVAPSAVISAAPAAAAAVNVSSVLPSAQTRPTTAAAAAAAAPAQAPAPVQAAPAAPPTQAQTSAPVQAPATTVPD